MGEPHTTAQCARIGKQPGDGDSTAPAGCAATSSGIHKAAASNLIPDTWGAGGQNSITVIDDSWGVPGLGTDGTLALGGMAIAAATVTIIAWRALAPMKPVRR